MIEPAAATGRGSVILAGTSRECCCGSGSAYQRMCGFATPEGRETIRLLVGIAEKDTLARVLAAITVDERFVVSEVVGDAAAAVAATSGRRGLQIFLLDVQLPGGGLSALAEIAACLPGTQVVMLASEPSELEFFAALAAGASGCLLKNERTWIRLASLLVSALDGEPAVSPEFVRSMIERFRQRSPRRRRVLVDGFPPVELTHREWEVLHLMLEGQRTAQIARRLCLSQSTIRTHIQSGLRKLGLGSRASAFQLRTAGVAEV